MTTHLTIDELYSLALDGAASSASATTHLATCAACRAESSALRQLANDLAIAQASAPSADALSRYQSLFTQVQQQPVLLHRIAAQVRAVLTWDSRLEGVRQGVRSGGATTYRQTYCAADAEVELMVEQSGRGRRIEGDLIANESSSRNKAALIELVAAGGQVLYTAETDGHGLFRLDGVAPGTYRMIATRAESPPIEIEALEIA